MSRVLGIVAVYVLMFLAWISVGLFMLFAPVRFGNLVHDSFGLYPEVRRNDWGRKLILRLVGIGLLGFAAHFALRVVALFGSDG
ncbi:MAG: hypothetical protein ABSG41_23885 [Bryobacteraceae bacterium]|jgi:hypothetical protein